MNLRFLPFCLVQKSKGQSSKLNPAVLFGASNDPTIQATRKDAALHVVGQFISVYTDSSVQCKWAWSAHR